jgi:hypothetical protein
MQAGVDPEALNKSHPEYARIHARVAEITATGMVVSVAWLFSSHLSEFLTGWWPFLFLSARLEKRSPWPLPVDFSPSTSYEVVSVEILNFLFLWRILCQFFPLFFFGSTAQGSRSGFVFKLGSRGLGYYTDTPLQHTSKFASKAQLNVPDIDR